MPQLARALPASLDRVFDEVRLAQISRGAARFSGFGHDLERLGRAMQRPANQPCVDGGGHCLVCDARSGEPCAHPSLKR